MSAAFTGWLCTVPARARAASMSLFGVCSAATAGTVHALIAAEAMRTAILLMIELHGASCEKSYSSACLPSIARELFRVRLWLRHINFSLEKTSDSFGRGKGATAISE